MKIYVKSAEDSDFYIRGDELEYYTGHDEHVVVPEGIKVIGASVFRDHDELRTVELPTTLRKIDSFAFNNCAGLEEVKIPDGVTVIGKYTFQDCTNLKKVKIPDSVTEIGFSAFENCKSLRRLKLPKGITTVAWYMCAGCTSLTSIVIPSGVQYIDEYAFDGCSSLKTAIIPQSVREIGDEAFRNCIELENLQMSDPKLGRNVFKGCDKLDKKNIHPAEDIDDDNDDLDEEMDFDTWYQSEEGQGDGEIFIDKLEKLVRSEYDVSEFIDEPSVQGLAGSDILRVGLADGKNYEFSFDWFEEQSTIYQDGPEDAAATYFDEVKEGIESGSAEV